MILGMDIRRLKDAAPKDWERWMSLVEEDRRQKIEKMKNPEVRQRSLAAGLLLYYSLCEVEYNKGYDGRLTAVKEAKARTLTVTELDAAEADLFKGKGHSFKILRDQKGKPYCDGHPEIVFSLSHSGDFAVCVTACDALKRGRGLGIGIDIQQVIPVRDGLAKRVFCPEEAAYIEECPEAFFDIWTLKEAYGKAVGDGIGTGLSSLDFSRYARRYRTEEKGYLRPVDGCEGDVYAAGLSVPDGYTASLIMIV